MPAPQYEEAEALEQYLGDPEIPDNPLSLSQARKLDDADASRETFMQILWDWGFASHYVPAASGGRLGDIVRSLAVLRCIARRDVTAAHQLGDNLLGALPVWIGGSHSQQSILARRLLGRQRTAFALSERAHGADVLANETTATPLETGYCLDGEKWPISQAAVCDVLTTVARTGNAGDPRGFSVFMIEKDSIAAGSAVALPREPSMGLRGADISGIRFDQCVVPSRARVGAVGEALDITLKTMSVSKLLVTALSVAATDACLRTVMAFALERKIFGSSVAAIPHARTTLAVCFAELLCADACISFASRAISVIPDQISLLGNVVKAIVPRTCERIQRDLAYILGGRFYLTQAHEWGVFEKMVRDSAIIGVFDGNSIVCLSAIAAQFESLLAYGQTLSEGQMDAAFSRTQRVARLSAAAPDARFNEIALHNRGLDDVVQSLPALLSRIETRNSNSALLAVGRQCLTRIKTLPDRIAVVRDVLGPEASRSRELYDLADEYASIVTVCVTLHLWYHNADISTFFAQEDWLILALERCTSWTILEPRVRHRAAANVFEELVGRYKRHEMFSLVPLRLAGGK